MKISSFIMLGFLIALFGCSENASIPESQGRELMRIWENGNIQALNRVITSDAIYEAAQSGDSYKGIDAFGRYVGHVNLFAKDLKIEVLSVNSTDTTAVLEWKMTGIQSRPIQGRVSVATNREFTVKGVTLVEVKNGLICKATDYMDVLGFVIQLGARVELPGGVVIGSKQEKKKNPSNRLVGTWKFISLVGKSSEGGVYHPYGENLFGMLMYDPGGFMSVLLMNPDRPKFASGDMMKGTPDEIKSAFEGFDAYCGTYVLDEEKNTVTHNLQVSKFPNWVGTSQVRFYEISGDKLRITAPPILAGGVQWKFEAVAVRL